jgi:hypothetical protein
MDLVPYGEESPFALLRMNPVEAKDLLSDALGGAALSIADLDRIKVPSGGGTSWEVPSLDGETATKTIEGVIIHRATRRAYWPFAMEDRPDDHDGTPDCQSNDGEFGIGEPGGACGRCPLNEFGSDLKGGPGKACKETRQLFVLTKDDLLPLVVVIPPASLANFKSYSLRLLRGQVGPSDVVTNISLEKVTGGKTPYSRVTFKTSAKLDDLARERVREYSAIMTPAFEQAARVEPDEA